MEIITPVMLGMHVMGLIVGAIIRDPLVAIINAGGICLNLMVLSL